MICSLARCRCVQGGREGQNRPARKLASILCRSRLLYTLGLVEIQVLPDSGQASHFTSISSLGPSPLRARMASGCQLLPETAGGRDKS